LEQPRLSCFCLPHLRRSSAHTDAVVSPYEISDRISAQIYRDNATSAIWKGDVATVADELHADLDELPKQTGRCHGSVALGSANIRMTLTKL